jgi:hypothetical protein
MSANTYAQLAGDNFAIPSTVFSHQWCDLHCHAIRDRGSHSPEAASAVAAL